MEQYNDDTPIIVAQAGPLNTHRWHVNKSLLVGREESCDIIIPSRQVSRHHAIFNLTGEGIYLQDLDSKNGTFVNGEEIGDQVLLKDGDLVSIALAQQFIYFSSDATMPLEGVPGVKSTRKQERLRLEKRSRRVWVGDQEIIPPLSLSQYNLLELLYEHEGRVVDRRELIQIVWGEEDAVGVSEQALDALIRRLRDRIAAIDPSHTYIVTVRGHGLRLDNPEE